MGGVQEWLEVKVQERGLNGREVVTKNGMRVEEDGSNPCYSKYGLARWR